MASPGSNVVTGQFIGTGAQLTIKTLQARPKVLYLNAGGASGMWSKSMADGSVYKRTAAGVGSLVTGGNGVTPYQAADGDGFTLGADADLNVNGTVVDYVAICE